MSIRRFLVSVILGGLVLGASAQPTLARKPDGGAGADGGDRPLTPVEQSASDAKVAAAEAYVSAAGAGGDLAPLACVTPTAAQGDLVALGCVVPQGFLAVEARDQIKWFYCGPAVGQVIANYSWAVAAGANKYTQGQIAGWMATDVNVATNAVALEAGLEAATARSPRRPANWDWVVTSLVDSDRDGATGDQLQDFVRANVSGSRMPLAISVKPHDPTSAFYLPSWPRPIASGGHWIALYGWVATYDGSDRARIYYTDSSRDEGGSTGKFWAPTRHIAILIGQHHGRFVW